MCSVQTNIKNRIESGHEDKVAPNHVKTLEPELLLNSPSTISKNRENNGKYNPKSYFIPYGMGGLSKIVWSEKLDRVFALKKDSLV